MDLEKVIPAFSMWKALNETIPALLNLEYCESNYKELESIIMSKEFLNLFIFVHDSNLSTQDNMMIAEKYKAFTMWLLGRFFNLMSCDKAKTHDLIVDAQLKILQHLSVTEKYVYLELSALYVEALCKLNNYHNTNRRQENSDKLILDLFNIKNSNLESVLDLVSVPTIISNVDICTMTQKNILKIVLWYTKERLEHSGFDDTFFKALYYQQYILNHCCFSLKLLVLHSLIQSIHYYTRKSANYKLECFFLEFIASLEQIVYKVFDENHHVDSDQQKNFENLLIQFLNNTKIIVDNINKNKMLEFLVKKIIKRNFSKVSEELKVKVVENYVASNLKNDLVEDSINVILINHEFLLLPIVQEYFFNYLKTYLVENKNTAIIRFCDFQNSIYNKIKNSIFTSKCSTTCKLFETLTILDKVINMFEKIKFNLFSSNKTNVTICFFEEIEMVEYFFKMTNAHVHNCQGIGDKELFFRVLTRMIILYPVSNSQIIFHAVAYPFLKSHKEFVYVLKVYNEEGNYVEKQIKISLEIMATLGLSKEHVIPYLFNFLRILKNVTVQCVHRDENDCEHLSCLKSKSMEDVLSTICISAVRGKNKSLFLQVIKVLKYMFLVSSNMEKIFNDILVPILNFSSEEVTYEILREFDDLIALFYNNRLIYYFDSNDIVLEICSEESNRAKFESCQSSCLSNKQIIQKNKTALLDINNGRTLCKKLEEIFYKAPSNRVTTCSIQKLSSLINFPEASTSFLKIVQHLICHPEMEVRTALARELRFVLLNMNNNNREMDELFIDNLFKILKNASKKSLENTDVKLQQTMLKTIESAAILTQREAILHVVIILLFFIMIPTSKYQLSAIHVLIKIAKKEHFSTNTLYVCYKKEICEKIVELSTINYELVGWNLSKSLEKISLAFGFFGSKDFVIQECRYLVPYVVPLVVKMPKVMVLLNEIAEINGMELSELLAAKYGNIFLNIFLNEPENVCKQCLSFIEKTTGTKGNVLRKRNFQVIMNELLLHFHTKTNHVIMALKLLAKEEHNSQAVNENSLPDYLQPRLLGVLAYFDIKLISQYLPKDRVLLSLAKLLEFMGPKHVTPVRFKIIAMLRTALNLNHGKFPEINCKVWEVFVKSCEIDALGPQVALIFISLLPLHGLFPEKIEGIFKYLIVKNETVMKDYIPDLFFVLESNVSEEICLVIRGHLTKFESNSFKEHLKWFLKYLNHESTDIKVHALKYLKRLLEKNREELDRMILGYNGIDPVIVELVDILVMGSRETDNELKLGCGLCIGELGAIEPSHLPRRYAAKSQTFTFFINEDSFIVDALNELTKALQAEKNTQNMDRFALAVQEILKMFGISPEVSSPRNKLWNQFPEYQQELMLPLLSSRYTMLQTFQVPEVRPIFGSSLVTSFQSWIYNWTCLLISAVKADKRSLLEVCLPSLKQDNRTLMLFLPYMLVHALLEGGRTFHQKVYEELMAVLNSYNNKLNLDVETLDVRPFRTAYSMSKPQSAISEEEMQRQCAKVVFVLFDFLDRWLREWQWLKGPPGRDHEYYTCLTAFVSRFCKLQIAQCNFRCKEYARALLYIEEYVSADPDRLPGQLGFLTEIYAHLDEPDGVAGIMALQNSEPSIEQRTLALEMSGKLADAAACYEKICPHLKPRHLRGLVQCYLDLENVVTALKFVEGVLITQPDCSNVLMEMQAEPLWRLGQFDQLEDLLEKPQLKENNCWGVRIGDALLRLRKEESVNFRQVVNDIRMSQMENLGAASLEEGAYYHGYNYVARLHILNELEQVEKLISALLIRPNDENAIKNTIEQFSVEWKLRMKIVQKSLKICEPILCIRRVALEQAKIILSKNVPNAVQFLDSLLGELWLLSAKAARASGSLQQAYTYTLKAEYYSPPKLFIEKAKLHWLREEHELALTTLRRGVEETYGPVTSSRGSDGSKDHLTREQRKLCAKAKLLIATYNDSLCNVEQEVNKQHYKEAIDVYLEWEKSLVHLAQYYDKIYQSMNESELNSNGGDIQILMINYFGKSLQYGNQYVYQSMPRLLSIWFDYGSKVSTAQDNVKDKRKENLLKMTKLIDAYLERLPAYVFLTAFSQIVSRICHPQKEVYVELKEIIVKLLQHYPQQSLWMIISVIKSSYPMRSKRCSEILNDSRLRTSSMVRLINDFTKLAEKLIDLCNKEIPDDVQTTNVSTLVRTLPRLITKEDFSEIMIPTQRFRKLILPNPDFKCKQHNPFPNHYVHIVGIEEEVTVLGSLQRPRKITFRGSDGKRYVQMLKPKDDLRKDFRLMEFNDIVNQLLSRDADSRQRRLNIRLYSVVPLNEECGLIEWIPDLVCLRPVLMKIYKQKGIGMKSRDLKQNCCVQRDPLVKKKEVFTKVFLPNHPPVLGEWFRKTFPDAQSWLTARTAYIRTTAVMSMVGYIVGLGDRHGENILLDSTCGDTVHVDFNCLFNKGEVFEWPERVPFRLTHNMVSAMGPLGVEGMFRKSCACTLRVLRANINTLMSIVTPFVYDPLVSWPKTVPAVASAQNAERTNEQARDHIKNMELRLQGAVKTKSRSTSMLFSVEGQTNILITEAMNVDNLCQMFIGWGAYL